MLRSIRKLHGYYVSARDGQIGRIHDFYFDDYLWKLRYLVVDAAAEFGGRRILLAPIALGRPSSEKRQLPVFLTRDQVKNSPEAGAHPPVSLRHQIELHRYYAWPLYWDAYGAGPGVELPAEGENEPVQNPPEVESDPRLRSVGEVSGYHIQAMDGGIGHVEDFIVEDDNWEFRYLVVDTRNWIPGGRRVLLSPEWVERIDWPDSKIYVDLTCAAVQGSPEYHPDRPVDRDYENALYLHHRREPYWRPGGTAAPAGPQATSTEPRTSYKENEPRPVQELPRRKRNRGGISSMLHPVTRLLGRELQASDGSAGKIEDVFFDQLNWKMRYIVVNAGGWAKNRRLLLSPLAIAPGTWNRDSDKLTVRMTKELLRKSPDFGEQPPTREQERQLFDYYSWPYYWTDQPLSGGVVSGATGAGEMTPQTLPPTPARATAGTAGPVPPAKMADKGIKREDLARRSGLGSVRKAIGFHLRARDGELGHVDNFIFDDTDWGVRYVQIDTSNAPGGKPVLLATEWLTGIDWDAKKVSVDIDRDTIRNSPEYHPDKLNRDFEARLYEYHRRPGYWRAA